MGFKTEQIFYKKKSWKKNQSGCLNCVCTCTHVMIKHLLSPPRWLIWYLKQTMFILCCILCCIWISLQHYYLYANYNAGGTHGLCHFLIIAFLMGDFLVYIFFPTTQTNWDFYLLYSIECDMFAKLEDSKVIYLLVTIIYHAQHIFIFKIMTV